MGKSNVWVLTYEVNEHDQHGEYFLAVFQKKPSYEQVVDYVVEAGDSLQTAMKTVFRLVDKGGGRICDEYRWFNLRAVELK